MSDMLHKLLQVFWQTGFDVLPIVVIIFGFQLLVIRRRVPNLKRVLIGFVYVLCGMSLFLVGLQQALFPLGELMAVQLADPAFIHRGVEQVGEAIVSHWYDYYWVYLFAACIGFTTALAEPVLLAVAHKASEMSGGAISALGLRIAVALGAGVGVALGSYQIVSGIPLHYFIIAGYILVIIQTYLAPRSIVALAYDTGGVTTSTVTVPVVTALGLGLAGSVPGRSVMVDGFGLIAFACLFPIISVLAYAQLGRWWSSRATPDQNG